jgi:hypothetical protein
MPDESDPKARLARVQTEIEQARHRLSRLRHEGERHFIDGDQVSPEHVEHLHGLVAAGDDLLEKYPPHLNPPVEEEDATKRLADIEARIEKVRHSTEDPHLTERHFIDESPPIG